MLTWIDAKIEANVNTLLQTDLPPPPQFALERLPRSRSSQLYASYSNFEKQFGDRSGIEVTVLGKRRLQYEEELSHESRNYDVWFDYARLEEDAYRSENGSGDALKRVREVYERAVAQVPPSEEKRHWRRYIFLWLNYALFEELDTKVMYLSLSLPLPSFLMRRVLSEFCWLD